MKACNPRLVLAAASSGSGKTVITCGLLKVLQRRKRIPVAFKCGPDYIDPMFHKYVLGIPGGNLDPYFLEEQPMRRLFQETAAAGDISVIEGVMGYYDGIGGNTTRASTYEVAVRLKSPVILIVNGKGASLSLAALVKGFLEYRQDSRIAGVILNRVSKSVCERLKPEIERLGVEILGYVPECEECRLESRHLGLVMPEETADLRKRIESLAVRLEETLNIDRIIELAEAAGKLPAADLPESWGEERKAFPVKIGVAMDQAFCFYYQENLRLLRQMGAEIIPFSPLDDRRLPACVDGILLGGGYPEAFTDRLSANQSMLCDIRTKIENGLPVLAECGGFLYLHQELESMDGRFYPMAGVIKGRAWNGKKLSRFGYIAISPCKSSVFLGNDEVIKGHEFHYWESENPGSDFVAGKPSGDRSYGCMQERGGMLCGFPHLYYLSNPSLPRRFLSICLEYRKRRGACITLLKRIRDDNRGNMETN